MYLISKKKSISVFSNRNKVYSRIEKNTISSDNRKSEAVALNITPTPAHRKSGNETRKQNRVKKTGRIE